MNIYGDTLPGAEGTSKTGKVVKVLPYTSVKALFAVSNTILFI
jgi:hypothetical protein